MSRWLPGLLGLGALLAFWRLGEPSLNVDEAFSLFVSREDLPTFLESMHYDNHPPLFYLLLKGWTAVVASEWWMRTLTVLAHLGCVALVVRWMWQEEGQEAAVYGGLLTAGSSWAILRAQEARQYALLALFAWLALWFLWRGRPALYALFMALAVYTHYNALLLLPAPWLWRPSRALALAQAGVLAAFAPWLPVLRDQFLAEGGTSVLLTESVYARPFLAYAADLLLYLGPGAHTGLPPWVKWSVCTLFAGAAGYGWWRLRDRSLARLLAACLLTVFAISTAVYLGLGRGLFTAKHAHFLYVGLYMLAGAGLAALRPGWRVGVTALLLACNLLSWYNATYDVTVQNPPWRRIAADVEARLRPGDAVVVFVPYQSLAYRHYARPDYPVYVGEPGASLEPLAASHPRVVLVLAHVGAQDPSGGLQAAFDARFRLVDETVYPNQAPFDQVRTRLYETR